MSAVPRFMLVTNRLASSMPVHEVVRMAVQGGVDTIQVREKDLEDAALTLVVRDIRESSGSARIVINGSIEIARAFGLGIQLPEHGPPIADARAALGSHVLIGRSVHSPESASQSDGADFVIAGHVFESASKPGRKPIGLDGLRLIAGASSAPVIAIGGMTSGNVRSVLAAGARGVAVMSAINRANDPEAAASEIAVELNSTDVEITLNGRKALVPCDATIDDFLHIRGFKDRLVVVEINGKIAQRSRFSTQVFETGDRVEIVHFVGGG